MDRLKFSRREAWVTEKDGGTQRERQTGPCSDVRRANDVDV